MLVESRKVPLPLIGVGVDELRLIDTVYVSQLSCNYPTSYH